MPPSRLLLALLLLVAACATWQPPAPMNYDDFRQRATAAVEEGVEVRALVLSPADGQRLFAADEFAHGIEPVWVEVINGSGQQLILLHAGADPDYFSPLEVSWLMHGTVLGGGDEKIDRHFQSLAFPRGDIPAGERRSGVIFTNPGVGTKMLNIDLIGDNRFISFTLFPPIPDESGDIQPSRPWPYQASETNDYNTEQALKRALEQYYLDVSRNEDLGQPLTTVLVGHREDIGAALGRRGYRMEQAGQESVQFLSGRPPDFSLRKWSQAGAPGNWIRSWVLPLTFQGRAVLVAQTGAPRGGRFATRLKTPADDPAVDYIRDLLVQDMLFSDSLAKLAILQPGELPARFADITDGKVAVLFIAAGRLGPEEALVTDWSHADWESVPAPYGERRALQK